MDFAQTLVAGMAAPSPVTPYTGTSIASGDASLAAPAGATAATGRPGLVLLAAAVIVLFAFGYWTR